MSLFVHSLERLVSMCSQIPNKREQVVRYYNYYSNVVREKRKSPVPMIKFAICLNRS
jgi:hypothetical protein